MQELIGKDITFKPGIEDMEAYAEGGMRARVVSVEAQDTRSRDKHDHVYKITFDYTEFDEYNRRFESSNYYDKNGKPTLSAREANWYNPQETIYFGSPELWPFEDYFEVNGEERRQLVAEFKASGETDYVAWLEQKVLAAN